MKKRSKLFDSVVDEVVNLVALTAAFVTRSETCALLKDALATSRVSDLAATHTQAHWKRILSAKGTRMNNLKAVIDMSRIAQSTRSVARFSPPGRTDTSTPESFKRSLEGKCICSSCTLILWWHKRVNTWRVLRIDG